MFVADTHALVWFMQESQRLSAAAAKAFTSSEEIVVPTIVLAEIKHLFAKKRISIDVGTVISSMEKSKNCSIYPIDDAVVRRMPQELDIHDGLIVGTALVFADVLNRDVAIITKDRRIHDTGFVRTVW